MLRKFLPQLKPSVPTGTRVYAIGDVHGRLDLLDQLLAKIERDNTSRTAAEVMVVLLGDLIDRGPDSRTVVARAECGVAWARMIALMGNHEAMMLDALDGKRVTLESWLRFGGRQTLESWGVPHAILDLGTLDDILVATRSAISTSELRWLGRMRSNLRVGDYFFVHAGIRPGIALEQQTSHDCLWIRDEFLDSRRKHGAIIVHGHSIESSVEDRPNRIGLDTGAYATGCLTAVGLEGEDRWYLSTAE